MAVNNDNYKLVNYNIKDSVGQFVYRVKLSDRIDYDTNTGYLYCKDAVVGNVGVQIYNGYELGFANGESKVKVHRKEEYIFAEDSLQTLEDKPITLEHPDEMVNSENVRQHIRGHVKSGSVRRDGDDMVCDLVIQDKELIDRIAPEDENGKRAISNEFRDLSLGYNAKLEPYEDTDEFVQTDIEYNHLAVVKRGRAANAIIRDSVKEKENKPMKFMDWLFGKKLLINDDETFMVIKDEEKVVSQSEVTEKREYVDPMEHDKKITSERKTTEVVKEDDGEDAEIKKDKEKENEKKETKDEGETVMKDKAYFSQAFTDAQKLPDGPFKQDTIKSLNEEYLEAFPRETEVKDSKPKESVTDKIQVTDSDDIGKEFLDDKKNKVDFAYLDKESKEYYDKLSNPESKFHDDHKAWEKYYRSQVKTGQSNLNL